MIEIYNYMELLVMYGVKGPDILALISFYQWYYVIKLPKQYNCNDIILVSYLTEVSIWY